LKLLPDEIHVWLAFDGELRDAAWLASQRSLLEPAELERLVRRRTEALQQQFLITRAMQRTVLAGYVPEVSPQDLRFGANEHGKPALAPPFAALGIQFNVAHTEGLVAMAVGREAVLGIDVENTLTRTAPLNIATGYFTAREASALALSPTGEQTRRFFALWTLKESWLKATGQGLSAGLGNASFELDAEHRFLSVTVANDDPRQWRFWQFATSSEHVMALAMRIADPAKPVRVITHRFSGQEDSPQA
jgi:4'-phosphopantetheinyl transferase